MSVRGNFNLTAGSWVSWGVSRSRRPRRRRGGILDLEKLRKDRSVSRRVSYSASPRRPKIRKGVPDGTYQVRDTLLKRADISVKGNNNNLDLARRDHSQEADRGR